MINERKSTEESASLIEDRMQYFTNRMGMFGVPVNSSLRGKLEELAAQEIKEREIPWDDIKEVAALRSGIGMAKSIFEAPIYKPHPNDDIIRTEIQEMEEKLAMPELIPAIEAIDAVIAARKNLPKKAREALGG